MTAGSRPSANVTAGRRRPGVRAAGVAGVCAVLGSALVVGAVAATPGLWFAGFLSEAGVASQPQSGVYRAGMFTLGLGLAALAVAVTAALRQPARVAVLLLGAAGAGVALSGAVTCSEGCPLPPHETPTPADWVHAGTAVGGVGALALAIVALGYGAGGGALRRTSRIAAWLVVPAAAATGLSILLVGRGTLTGLLERVTVTGALGWTLAATWVLLGPARRSDGESARP
jgi:hypothetical protein